MATAELVARISTRGAQAAARQLRLVADNGQLVSDNMDNADRSSASFRTSLTRLINPTVAAVKVLATMATAVSGVTIATAALVRENANQAAVAGLTIQNFNAMSFAASQFGVTTEQLSDQFKDVNEKIGEFSATGGGGFQDYLDVMGVGAEKGREFANSLRGVSGQDALGIMIANMQRAGKTTQEMSFAVEGLASDLTKSLPLFLDNSSALKGLTNEFKNVTSPLTKSDVALYAELSKNVGLSMLAFRSLSENALIPVVGFVDDLAKKWTFLLASMNSGTSASITSKMADIADEIKELEEAAENAGTGWGRLENALTFNTTTESAAKNRIVVLKTELEGLREEYNKLNGLTLPEQGSSTPKLQPITTTKGTIDADALRNKNKLQAENEYNAQSLFLTEEQYAIENEMFNAQLSKEQELLKQRKEANEQAYLDDLDFYTDIIGRKADADKAAEELKKQQQKEQLSSLSSTTDNIGALLGEQSSAYKALAITEATISTYLGAQKAFAGFQSLPQPYGLIAGTAAAGVAVAAGLKNVAQITSAREQGGVLAAGQTSSVAERNEIEFLTPQSSSRVRTANQMKSIMGEGGSNSVSLTVIDQSSGDKEYTQETKTDGEIVLLIRNTVSNDLSGANTQISKSITANTNATRRRG